MFGSKKQSKANEQNALPEGIAPIDVLLIPFTRSARELHKDLGFAGVLIALGVLALGMVAVPGYELGPTEATIIAGLALGAAVTTYAVRSYVAFRQAEIQTAFLRDYTKLFLDRYFSKSERSDPEHIEWAMTNIVLKLAAEDAKSSRHGIAPPTS